MDVTHPKLLDAEGTGSTFPQSLYFLATTAYNPTILQSSSTLLSNRTPHTFLKLPQSTL